MPEQNPNRKQSYVTLITVLVIVIVLGVAGYYAWKAFAGGTEPVSEPTPVPQAPVDTTVAFASSTLGVSLKYPQAFILDEAFANTSVNPKKPISGVQFKIPVAMATGTNLSADSYVSLEQLPRAKVCTGDIFIAANVKPMTFVDGAITYSVATSSGAGAGNFYEEAVFAVSGSSPCIAIRYFVHSTNIGNYPAGSVQEFNRAALVAEFDKIRHSLIVQPAVTP